MKKRTGAKPGTKELAVAGCCLAVALASLQAFGQNGPKNEAPGAAPSGGASRQADDADLLSDILSSEKSTRQDGAPAQPANGPKISDPAPAVVEPAIPIPDVAGDKTSAPNTSASAAPSRQIEEIVVTATKREESLRDIPASISAFTGASLENSGKLNLNDFIQESPGVVASQQSPGFTRISMRGISTDTSPSSINPSTVGIFIGDTAFTDPYISGVTPDLSAFDLAGVQVLKGPQGTLFGGAALSGAIRYELQEPVLGEWQVRGFSQYSSPYQGVGALTSGAAINIPLLKDDGLAFRFDYIRRNNPGQYSDTRTDPVEKGIDRGSGDQVRAILLWKPNDDWKVKLTHLSQDYSAPNAETNAESPDGPRQSGDFVLPSPVQNSFGLDSLEVNYNFGSVRLVSLSSEIQKKLFYSSDLTPILAGTPPPGYPAQLGVFLAVDDNSRAFSQELRLQSTGDGPFQWLVGGYFYNYRLNYNILADTVAHQDLGSVTDLLGELPGILGDIGPFAQQTTDLLYGVNNAKSQERAIFADLSYKLWDRLELSAGGRFYTTSVSGGFIATGVLVLTANNLSPVNLTNRIAERGVNPKFSATYHFSDDLSLYALASKGFRFGGLQEVPSTATNGVPSTYKSDSLWNYELGLRTSWLEDTLHADLTGFYIRYKNPIIEEATQGVPLNYDVNVSSAISRGLEASLLWHPPVDGMTLSASGGLTDAHITSPFTAVGGVEVQPGTQMPGAARSQYSTSIQYQRPLWIAMGGGEVGYTYIGKGFSNITHDIPINDFGSLNAGVFLIGGPEAFRVRLGFNVTNILDKTVPITGTVNTALDQITKVDEYVLNQPRTYTLRLSLDL